MSCAVDAYQLIRDKYPSFKPKYVIEKYLENENKKNKKGIIYLTEQNRDFNTGALKISTIELQGEDGKSKNEFYFKS